MAYVSGKQGSAQSQCTRTLWLPWDIPSTGPRLPGTFNPSAVFHVRTKEGMVLSSLSAKGVSLPSSLAVSLLRVRDGYFLFSKSSLHPLGTSGHWKNVGHTSGFKGSFGKTSNIFQVQKKNVIELRKTCRGRL